MNKNAAGLLALVILAIIIVGSIIYQRTAREAPEAPPPAVEPTPPPSPVVQPAPPATPPEAPIPAPEAPEAPPAPRAAEAGITQTDEGFFPAEIRVRAGASVTFRNQSSRPGWPASNVHPIHTDYPDSGIFKCGTAEASNIFDACRGIPPGDSWTFKFEQTGRWGYHDHLRPGFGGLVVVE